MNQKRGRVLPSLFLYLLITVSLLFSLDVSGQNHKCKTVIPSQDILLDSLPIEGRSISVVPFLAYTFNPESNTLSFSNESLLDSVEVCFRTISPEFYEPIIGRPIETYSRGRVSQQVEKTSSPLIEEEIFAFENIQSYGSISRGITFGNRQNVFVNSSLNLQMDGALSEDLRISAVITDQNIPYQPEGNTQQLRDFDNVFIKLYTNNFEIVAGDIVLQNPVESAQFLKYYKNVQGLKLKYNYTISDTWKATSEVSGSLAKGQFTSAVIQPIEGVQGPYKLRGRNGERFVIILANSEKVYVDGQLLDRGFDRDYVIDYNLGEITFSSTVLITRYSRIRIDYEYADQYYGRSNVSATQNLQSNNTNLYLQYYREKDNSASTLGFDLSPSDIQSLRDAGDQNGLAEITGIDSVQYAENSILYKYLDTMDLDGNPVRIVQFTKDPNEAILTVSFSEVGTGQGDYVLANTLANGRVYEWVSPVNGQSQGKFAPVQQIPLPNKRQMFVFGARQKLGDNETVFQELAVSGFDQNLYSPTDDNDNQGIAWKGGLTSVGRSFDFLPTYKINAAFDFEYDQEEFRAIDRFRSIDFDRDWSYDVFSDTISRSDQIINGSIGIRENRSNGLNYRFSSRTRKGVIDGQQHEILLNKQLGPLAITSNNFYSFNQPHDVASSWLRTSQQLQWTMWRLQPGYQYQTERQQVRNIELDSIQSTLMHFTSHNVFVETADTTAAHFRMDYVSRKDQLPVFGELEEYTEAEEFKIRFDASYFLEQTIGVTINYRKVTDLLDSGGTEKNLLGKIDWSGGLFNKHLKTNLVYSTANARELKREFIFLQVATGDGTHTWRDDNSDGIQDLNEFYLAINPDEKNYIKVFSPTDEYINAYQTTMVQTADLRMPMSWANRTGLLKYLSKLSFNRNVRYNFKTTNRNATNRLIPFGRSLSHSDILFYQSQQRNSLFYNRNARGVGVDLVQSTQKNKSLLSNGYELNEKNDWEGAFRLGIGNGITIRAKGGFGATKNASDFFDNRNFNIHRNHGSSEVVFQPGNTFRLIVGYDRRNKNTVNSEQEGKSIVNEYSLESTWIRATKGSLNSSFHWLNIQFEGDENSYLGYELLEALKPGNNQRWNVNWQQTIGKGLQLTLQYNGRKSTDSKSVHTGSMAITAYF